jgi:hypothetical protein
LRRCGERRTGRDNVIHEQDVRAVEAHGGLKCTGNIRATGSAA